VAHTFSLPQPRYFNSSTIRVIYRNHPLVLMDAKCQALDPEKRSETKIIPNRKLVGKLLYLAITTGSDFANMVGVVGFGPWGAAK
jgi:hypothetical protein